ncbi:MAG: PAS domain-containing protein [Armatimonadetes bacterium]|nr:PAS domain-containing protein [Armatimonadota bacterium]
MQSHAIWYALPLLWGAGLELLLAIYAWRRRARVTGAAAFALLLVAIAVWVAGYGMELLSRSIEAGLLWAKVQWVGIATVPVAWFVFAFHYSGRTQFPNPRQIALLSIPGLLAIVFAWTNEYHGLMYAQIGTEVSVPFTVPVLQHGIWWRLSVAYAYALLLAGTVILLQSMLQTPRLFRGQAAIVLAGVAPPWVANIAFIAGAFRGLNLDLTPYAFLATGAFIFWGLFKHGFLETVPIACEAIVSAMRDGVIVLNGQGRIIDMNPAGEEITGLAAADCLGTHVAEALGDWPELLSLLVEPANSTDQTATVERAGRLYDVRVSTLDRSGSGPAPRTCVFRDITQRARAAEQLAQSEQRWRLLFERSPVGIFHCDTDLILTECNDRFIEILQTTRERLAGLDLKTLKDTRVLSCIRAALDGHPGHYEGPYQATTSAATVWVSLDSAPVTDAHGNVTGAVTIVTDLTDRKASEVRIERLAQGLRQVVSIADELIACDDLDEMLRKAVELPRERLGVERCSVYLAYGDTVQGTFGTDLQGRTTDERDICQDAWPTLTDLQDEACSQHWNAPVITQREMREGAMVDVGTGWVAHTPIRSATKSLGFFLNDCAISGGPVDPNLQDIIAIYCSLLGNILERKRTEQALRASERAGWVMLNATHDMAMLVSRDWRIEAINDAMAAELRRPTERLVGARVAAVIPAQLVRAAEPHAEQALRTGQPARFDGSDDGRHYSITLYPIVDEAGDVQRVAVFVSDLTEQRQAEESQRLAAVGQLAAGVAHEFNNILAVMSGRAQLAEAYRRPEDFDELIDAVHRGTARGSEICRNLTSFARPVEPRRAPVNIEEAIEAALRMNSRELANASVEVERRYGAGNCTIWADAGQLEQVFLNLFINACHAMAGGGTLTIETRIDTGADGQRQVVVTVADTGIGIPPEYRSRVFEPFFTTKGRLGESDIPGSGLGLSVSRSIVEAHGGTISLTSEVGEGTVFELRFAEGKGEQPPEPETKSMPCRLDDRTRRRLLVAEDEPDLRSLLDAFLQQRGFEVVVAADAPSALNLLKSCVVDLVVTDYLMPGGGGGDVLRCAREIGVPAIVVSGRSDTDALASDLRAQGAARLLAKPFALDDLINAVLQTLAEASEQAPVPD